MTHKRLPKAVLFALAGACVLTACSGEPVPVETSTPSPVASQGGQYLGFDTEEEAIAAAQEVYAKYIAAVNDARLGDPEAAPMDYLTGKVFDMEVETQALMASRGLTIEGQSEFTSLESALIDDGQVQITVCSKLNSVIRDAEGNDVTPDDRPEKQALKVTVALDADDRLRITDSETIDDPRC